MDPSRHWACVITKYLAWNQILILDHHEQFGCLWVANAFSCSGTLANVRLGLWIGIGWIQNPVSQWPVGSLKYHTGQASCPSPPPSVLGNHKHAGLWAMNFPRHEAMGGHSKFKALCSLLSSFPPSHKPRLVFHLESGKAALQRTGMEPFFLSLGSIGLCFSPLRAVVLWSTNERAEGKESTPQISRLVLWDESPHGDGFCENY